VKYRPSLVINVLIPTIILIVIIHLFLFYQSYNYYKKIIITQKKSQVDHTLKELADRLDSIKQNIEIFGKTISETYDLFHPSKRNLIDLLKKYLLFPGISGVGFITPQGSNELSVYIWQQDGKIKTNNLAVWYKRNNLNYTDRLWYKIPYETGKPYFSKPSPNDAGAKKFSSTYSIPMFNKDAKFIGVITLDLLLNWVDEIFAQLTAQENIDYTFVSKNYSLISKKGNFLVQDDKKYLNSEYKECINKTIIKIDKSKNLKDKFDNGKDDFTLNNSFPKERISVKVSTVFNGKAYLFVFLNENVILSVLKEAICYQALTFCICSIIVFICLYFLLVLCLNPIKKITNCIKNIARQDFNTDYRVKPVTREIEILNRSIRIMQLRLKHYFDNIADNTRLNTEMEFAKHIQESLIPEISSKKQDIDMHWILFPAEEVGGDFCNYVTFDDGYLFISIGDVTGKGIPAAFYTTVMITMEKLMTKIYMPLSDMVKIINSEIIKFNKSELFISYLTCSIHMETGDCSYVNAGHLPALILKSDGQIIKTKKGKGTFLGIFEHIEYNEEKIKLDKNDIILIYTDGITEAVNENNELFGEKKLIMLLEKCHNLTSKEIIDKIYSDVIIFRGATPQSDDICMLCYRQK